MGRPYPSAPSGYDPDYEAILNFASSQGYTLPSSGQQDIQNTLMLAYKAANGWSRCDMLKVYATDGDQNFSCIDWKNPTSGRMTSRVSSPTFTTNQGYNSNGTTSYLNTNYNAATQGVNYTQNDASQFMWIHSTGASATLTDTPICGLAANNGNNIFISNTAAQRINQGTATSLAAAVDFTGAGWKSLNRTSSTVVTGFKNTTRTDTTATSAAVGSSNTTVLRRGTNNYNNINSKVAIFGMGANMVNENTGLYNAFNNYMSAL